MECGKKEELALKFTPENKEEEKIFSLIQKTFSLSLAVEIVGRRRTGKSLFLTRLFKENSFCNSVLVITKGAVPDIACCTIYTATEIDTLLSIMQNIISGYPVNRVELFGIDTLTTLLATKEGAKKKEKIYSFLKKLLLLGIRVIVVSSIIFPVKKTSSFFSESIVFKNQK